MTLKKNNTNSSVYEKILAQSFCYCVCIKFIPRNEHIDVQKAILKNMFKNDILQAHTKTSF